MDGISYIMDTHNRKTAVVINLKTIEDHEEDVHDSIDALIAESRKGDELVDWETAKEELRAAG